MSELLRNQSKITSLVGFFLTLQTKSFTRELVMMKVMVIMVMMMLPSIITKDTDGN